MASTKIKAYHVFKYFSPDIPDDPEETPLPPPEDIPDEAMDALVPLDAIYRVFHHGETAKGDSHRFSVTADPEDATSRVVYNSLPNYKCSDLSKVTPFAI